VQAAVVGLGKSGEASALLLRHLGYAVTVWDSQHTLTLETRANVLREKDIQVNLGQTLIPTVNLTKIVVSPGVPWDMPFLQTARQMGITVQGEVALAWEVLRDVPWIAVTGTNGKTTTTALLAAIWQAHGFSAPACGNIGQPICTIALDSLLHQAPDWIVAELSSFQIEQSPTVAPRIALWTTFTPDHLNRHGTSENYGAIKKSLLERAQTPILNGDDPYVRSLITHWPEALWTATTETAAFAHVHDGIIWCGGQEIMPVAAIQLLGQHNIQNVLLAIAAACQAGIPAATIAGAVAKFQGVPHRLERVGVQQQIAFINDSKATNYDASIVALQAMTGKTILLAGGEMKAGDPAAWIAMIKEKTLGVVLFGRAAPIFAEFLATAGYNAYEVCSTLNPAVTLAFTWALARGATSVLLSPACASYDQFANFEERGCYFRQAVDELGTGSPTPADLHL
jgi:UDP-N-acetylmuramoylalanine--D-glutamate ligase